LGRNCLLKHTFVRKIKGGIEVMERQGRRRKQLLDNLKEIRGYRRLKKETRDPLCGNIYLDEAMDMS
jgi:hypothetical protein